MRQVEERDEWLSAHPEAARCIEHLDREIDLATPKPEHALDDDLLRVLQHRAVTRGRDLGAELDFGP
jgi:hypothetical protein